MALLLLNDNCDLIKHFSEDKMKTIILAVLFAGILTVGMSTVARATVIFSDNFESDSTGLNKTSLNNWTISSGNVDLIGVGTSWNYFPIHGKYVDMDGSVNNAGLMLSLTSFTLGSGDYQLSFDLAGNQRVSQNDSVIVKVNSGISDQTYSRSAFDPFQTFTQSFSLSNATNVTLSFEGTGGDNIGMLLDNVLLTKVDSAPVPEPGTMMLLGMGVLGMAVYGKRRMNKES
jgi:hypothetical protein